MHLHVRLFSLDPVKYILCTISDPRWATATGTANKICDLVFQLKVVMKLV